jgi:hypothetical protein
LRLRTSLLEQHWSSCAGVAKRTSHTNQHNRVTAQTNKELLLKYYEATHVAFCVSTPAALHTNSPTAVYPSWHVT